MKTLNKKVMFLNAHAFARDMGIENGDYRVRFSIALKLQWSLYKDYKTRTLKSSIKIVGHIDLRAIEKRESDVVKASIWHEVNNVMKIYKKSLQKKKERIEKLRAYAKRKTINSTI